MRFATVLPVLILTIAAVAQDATKLASKAEPKFATVPLTLDHDRIIVDADVRFSDGTAQRVHAWVDNGNPDLYLSRRLAALTGGSIACDGQLCSATPPVEMDVGGMTIILGGRIPGAGIKAWVSTADSGLPAPGLKAEINIPSTVLSRYDVLINFPDHELTIAQPGSLKFKGVKTKVIVNGANGLIQVPSQIENKKYNLGLDLGSPISFLSEELFDKLSTAHTDWPHMIGAIGPANISGARDELSCRLMRVDRVQFGPLFLTDVAVVEFPKDREASLQERAGIPTAGLIGANSLINYRVGIDYAHSTVYFDIGRLSNFPDFDVVGLILRPEDDGQFTIVGIADVNGEPSLPEGPDGVQVGDQLIAVDGISVSGSTLGQVWAMLGGVPGKERTLTIERSGKRFSIAAKVQHFLGDLPEEGESRKKSKKK